MLVGRRLGHSFSANYFNDRFRKEHRNAHYSLCEIETIQELPQRIQSMPGLVGFNVTIPYKEEIIPFIDELTPLADTVGAVNTVKVISDAKSPKGYRLKGHNTDVEGFMESLRTAVINREKSGTALVLGSGGASKAVCAGLRELGFEPTVVSRHCGKGVTEYNELTPEQVWQADIIVNATPAGMYPETNCAPPFPFQYMRHNGITSRPRQIAFDLVYNPEETLFMKICSVHGAITMNGLAMLHRQAEAAWSFWQS